MPVRRRRSTTLAAAVATAAALGATALAGLGATTASAAERPLTGYELTWGIKQSYRTYVGMFGGFTPSGGASQAAGNGAFTFVEGTGTYDGSGHTVDLAFKGGLVSRSAAHGFEITFSDVRFDSKAGEVTADLKKVDTSQGAPKVTEGDDVPLATVTVTRAMTDMATTLTAEAGEYLGSASYAGAAGDPLTVVKKAAPEPSPTPTTSAPTTEPSPTASQTQTTEPQPSATQSSTAAPSPTATAGTSASPTATATASATATATRAPAEGAIADGTLGWGVKESFRAYVVGDIAKGRVTVSGGATQAGGNGAFTFTDATGTYDTDAGRLTASFRGAVNFKGHESNGAYGLDLTLSNLMATLDGGTGQLTADVDSLGARTEGVVLADLQARSADLTARDDVITVDAVAATLTKAGAKVFGTYPAGTALDTVDLSVALSEDAQLPGGGSTGTSGGSGGTGGSGTSGGTGGSATTGGSTVGGTGSTVGGAGSTTGGLTGGGSLASTGSDLPGPALGAAAGAAVALGAGAVFAARKRRSRA
ncbi:HtaA domain-containing protein [Streptomyces sp. NPDC006284]|uniref:HtaA domain-containing protein n=1 Tax=Streptomyces sp. NPDC006284 TaxID=3156742 RepID=UPI0033AAEDD2